MRGDREQINENSYETQFNELIDSNTILSPTSGSKFYAFVSTKIAVEKNTTIIHTIFPFGPWKGMFYPFVPRFFQPVKTMVDGWLNTGDIAKMDEDGYVYIVDREKDLIIAGGYNIYPREVEEVIYENPKVSECAVIGVKDEHRGETVKAFIVKKDSSLTDAEIINFCKERLAVYKVPKIIEFRDELPLTLVGKVDKKALRGGDNGK